MYIPENSQNIINAIKIEQKHRMLPLAGIFMLWLLLIAVFMAAAFVFNHTWYIYFAMALITGLTANILQQLNTNLKLAPMQVAQSYVAAATEWPTAMLDLQWETVTDHLRRIQQLEDMGYDQHHDQRTIIKLDLACMQEFLRLLRPYGIGLASVQFTTETDHIGTRLSWMKAHCLHRQANMEGIHFPFTPSPTTPKTLH